MNEKMKLILNAPSRSESSQLKSFLGMLQYYHRHLPNRATTFEQLHSLLRKGIKWDWGVQQQVAFEKAKKILARSELLVHYDPQKLLVLAMDVSPYGLGAVLSHVLFNGEERPVAYASRTMNAAQRNYYQTERNELAVVFGVKKFQ